MTILNQTVNLVKEGYTWGFHLSLGTIYLLIVGFSFIFIAAYIIPEDKKHIGVLLCFLCLLILGIVSVISAFHSKPIYREVPQYEVIIDDSVAFHEIYDKYDVIEQRGNIFVLQEKVEENNE